MSPPRVTGLAMDCYINGSTVVGLQTETNTKESIRSAIKRVSEILPQEDSVAANSPAQYGLYHTLVWSSSHKGTHRLSPPHEQVHKAGCHKTLS